VGVLMLGRTRGHVDEIDRVESRERGHGLVILVAIPRLV
jgi:hypothetical protein